MFVSLERLELRNKDTKDMRKDSKHNIDVNGDDGLSKEKNKELNEGKNKDAESLKISTSIKQSSEDLNTKNFEHKEGDTVWVFINDKPKRGVLKYIGRPPGALDVFVGIQMVRNKLACLTCVLSFTRGAIFRQIKSLSTSTTVSFIWHSEVKYGSMSFFSCSLRVFIII